MIITNQAQYDEVNAKAAEINCRGSRFRELQSRSMGLGAELSESEKAEWEAILAEYSELCAAMRAYNEPAMDRAISSLNSADY